MEIFLSKFLPLFIYPLGLACVLILVSLFLVRRTGWQRASLLLAFALLFLGGNRFVAMGLTRALEWRYLPPKEVPQAEVIVLLGGGTLPNEYPRSLVEVNGAGDRLFYTAWLYQQGKAPHILLSGARIDWMSSNSSPTEEMATLLQMLGVPREAMWFESNSLNTYENALNCGIILRERAIQRILLVTSAWHMPRAVRAFEAQGFEVTPLPTDFTVSQSGWGEFSQRDIRSQLLGLVPNADYLAQTTRTLKEILGILYYDIRGWK